MASEPSEQTDPEKTVTKPYTEATHRVWPEYVEVTFRVPLEDAELFEAFFAGAGIDPAFIEWTAGEDMQFKVLMEGSIEHRFSLWWDERYVKLTRNSDNEEETDG